jgi:hypothetical protein
LRRYQYQFSSLLLNFIKSYVKEHFPPITTRRTLEINLNMPNLRPSTLKQRAHTKSENARIRKHTARRKAVQSPRSSPSINHGLGTMSHLPPEIRQAIFEQIVPAETPFGVTSDNFDIDEEIETEDNPKPMTSAPASLTALLCTSKAISTEVKRIYRNREYQLCLSATGIAFEGIRSVVSILCYCSGTGPPQCNHCSKDLIWKVANSTHQKPLRRCDALKGFTRTLPAIRRLHVTFTNDYRLESEWIRNIKRICSASGIWVIIRKAESAGVELHFTIDFPRPTSRPLDISFIREFFPAQYESRVTVKEPSRLMNATLFFPSQRC